LIRWNETSNRWSFTNDGTNYHNIPTTDEYIDSATSKFPTTYTWTGGTTAGPTGSLTGNNLTAISFGAIPSASATASGIITTDTQTIAGAKTFSSTITGSVTGNAGTATTLATGRDFSLTGEVTAPTVSFNGSGAVALSTTIAANAVDSSNILALSVSAAKIQSGAVTTAKFATGAVDSNALGALSVSSAKLQANIPDSKLATISTASKVANSATTATNLNTANAIVARDGSGNFTAGTITAALSGNATTATTLQTARNIGGVSFNGSADINLPGVNTTGNQNTSGSAATLTTARDFSLTGEVTASAVSFNGSGAVALSTTIAANAVDSSNILALSVSAAKIQSAAVTTAKFATGAVDSNALGALSVSSAKLQANIPDSKLATISTASKVANSATTATSANTASAIVARDASGNFTAGVVSATQFVSTNNATGKNYQIGDDAWIGDVNVANTTRIVGAQDSSQGYIIFGNGNNVSLGRSGTGPLTYGGIFRAVELTSTNAAGDEGGQINLAIPLTNTTLGGTVTVDVFQNRLRIFEGSGNAKGAYIDLSACANNAGTNLLGGSTPGDGTLTLAVAGTGLSGSASFTANQSGNSTFTVTSNATSANTANAIVARDSSGNFSAGTITTTALDTATAASHYFVETGSDNVIRPKTLANVRTEVVTTAAVNAAAATTTGTVTSGTWSASFGAVSGANLTSLTAGNLSGTIPSAVLGNSSLFVGTTSVALNRASANQGLTGITSIAMPGATSGTVTMTPATTAGTTAITIPATSGTLVTTGDNGTVTSTMIANDTIVNADINASAAIVDTKLATISTAGKVSNSATTATSANTANAIVARDASGNFSAQVITAGSILTTGVGAGSTNISPLNGPILTLGTLAGGGSGYMNGTHTNQTLTGGSPGEYMRSTVVVSAGVVTSITLTWGGVRYPAGSTLTVPSLTTTLATTGASGTGTTATITFATQAAAPFQVGSQIVVAGVTPTGYNGTFTVTACTTTSVSYASATTGAQTVAGTISMGAALTNATIPISTVKASEFYAIDTPGGIIRLERNSISVAAGDIYGEVAFSSYDNGVQGSGDLALVRGVADGTTGGGELQFHTAVNATAPKIALAVKGNNDLWTYNAAGTFYHNIVKTATANRTLTLPDVTGTVVTTGDNGTVTSTMIANNTIVSGDFNSVASLIIYNSAGTALKTMYSPGS
jgi:hypothetical protein